MGRWECEPSLSNPSPIPVHLGLSRSLVRSFSLSLARSLPSSAFSLGQVSCDLSWFFITFLFVWGRFVGPATRSRVGGVVVGLVNPAPPHVAVLSSPPSPRFLSLVCACQHVYEGSEIHMGHVVWLRVARGGGGQSVVRTRYILRRSH